MVLARVLIAFVAAALVAGCGGSAKPHRADESGAIVHVEAMSGPNVALPADAASGQRMTYVSRSGIDDSRTHVTGSVYVPRGPVPAGGFHVVVYGRAVHGTSPGCAPPPDRPAINTLLKAGYVVAVPDYQGLGVPSEGKLLYHPVLDSTTAGYNMLDAARAAKNLVSDTSPIWVAVGEVQGGQAAWALNELADNYGFQSLRGTVSIAPVADLSSLADAAADGKLTPEQRRVYIGYLAALASEYGSQFRLDDYRRGVVTQNWELLLTCRPDDDAARAAVNARIGPDDLRPTSPSALTALHHYLDKTSLPQGPAQQPMLVTYGDRDPLTPTAWTERAITRACQMRDPITVRRAPTPTLDSETMDWVARRLREQPVANDCPTFLAAHPMPPTTSPPASAAKPVPNPVPAAVPRATPIVAHEPEDGQVSLIDGWVPVTIQALAALTLIVAVGWRSRSWLLRRLPVATVVGAACIGGAWWFADRQGWGSVYPCGMWVWIGLAGLAVGVLILSWRGSAWWRRAVSVLAVPMCVVAAGAVLNASLGYLPTATAAWQRVTGTLPPQWIDQTTLAQMRRDGIRPTRGTVVRITTPGNTSGFTHRDEFVYLPPAWFTSTPPPALPVVMMLGAELSSGAPLPSRCSPTSAGRSPMTPNASTARAATPPTISSKRSSPLSSRTSVSARNPRTGDWRDGHPAEPVPSHLP